MRLQQFIVWLENLKDEYERRIEAKRRARCVRSAKAELRKLARLRVLP